MSDTIELNDKLVSELREIAKSLGVAGADELRKAPLIAAIVEQQQLIEAARNQQSVVENNYSEKTPAAAPAPAENTDKTRKRTRTLKTKEQPRVEVPLDDTNLFNNEEEEQQTKETDGNTGAPESAPVSAAPETSEKPEQPGQPEPVAEGRPQKFERRSPQQQQKSQEPAINLDFDNVIVNEGVLEIMPDGYGFLRFVRL